MGECQQTMTLEITMKVIPSMTIMYFKQKHLARLSLNPATPFRAIFLHDLQRGLKYFHHTALR